MHRLEAQVPWFEGIAAWFARAASPQAIRHELTLREWIHFVG
jgi:hypothetical protein